VIRGFAIGGKAGVGKNAFAEELMSQLMEYGYWPTQMAFGDTLKAEVWQKYRLRKEDEGGRQTLIEHGDMRRDANPDYFVKSLSRKVSALWPYSALPVITDVRRWNEFNWCVGAGFYMVRVEASIRDQVRALRKRGEMISYISQMSHPTEVELDEAPWDCVVRNRHEQPLDTWAELVVQRFLMASCPAKKGRA
jgi:hypothetical protein